MFIAHLPAEEEVEHGGIEKSLVENLGVLARGLRRKGL
jgi:hypothetical protein